MVEIVVEQPTIQQMERQDPMRIQGGGAARACIGDAIECFIVRGRSVCCRGTERLIVRDFRKLVLRVLQVRFSSDVFSSRPVQTSTDISRTL